MVEGKVPLDELEFARTVLHLAKSGEYKSGRSLLIKLVEIFPEVDKNEILIRMKDVILRSMGGL